MQDSRCADKLCSLLGSQSAVASCLQKVDASLSTRFFRSCLLIMKFEPDKPEPDKLIQRRPGRPGLLFIAPCLGGLILAVYSPSIGGGVAALLWTGFALALAIATLALVKRLLHRSLRALTEAEYAAIALRILTPMLIAEPLRFGVVAILAFNRKADPMEVFRVVASAEWLISPGDLVTAIGLLLMIMKIRGEFQHRRAAQGARKVALLSLTIIAILHINYALTGVAAFAAVMSTITLHLM